MLFLYSQSVHSELPNSISFEWLTLLLQCDYIRAVLKHLRHSGLYFLSGNSAGATLLSSNAKIRHVSSVPLSFVLFRGISILYSLSVELRSCSMLSGIFKLMHLLGYGSESENSSASHVLMCLLFLFLCGAAFYALRSPRSTSILETLQADMKKERAIKRPLQANYVLREIHEGSCSMHAGTRSVVAKALRTGYYWPTMHRDARTLIRACRDCQVHKPIPRNPQQKLTPITSPWPFYKWGIDIAGPFLEGPGKVKFLIVAMDYFTKWIEAKPVATITGNQIKKFVWDNIVCRFGLPGEIISDNGKQFRDDPFKDWCEKLCINQHFASVKHPQTNGLVERANRSLGEGIKARLEVRSKNWMEELPHVLWAHRTMIKSSNGDTPFSLTYRTKAVIPAEIGMPTIRTVEVDLVQNNEALEINLDLLEERREEAAIQDAKSKAKMEKYYNAKVRNTSFKPGDLVYRNNDASRSKDP
ncbi:reverse transcriptase domain-containing protein [Tanacetum coccineum]